MYTAEFYFVCSFLISPNSFVTLIILLLIDAIGSQSPWIVLEYLPNGNLGQFLTVS